MVKAQYPEDLILDPLLFFIMHKRSLLYDDDTALIANLCAFKHHKNTTLIDHMQTMNMAK